jgi:hypothetical protein
VIAFSVRALLIPFSQLHPSGLGDRVSDVYPGSMAVCGFLEKNRIFCAIETCKRNLVIENSLFAFWQKALSFA